MAQKLFFGLLLTLPLASYVMQLACAIDLVVPLYRGGSHSVHQPDLEIAIIHDHVNILFRLLHVIEYSVLIVGICKCHKSEKSDFNLLKSLSDFNLLKPLTNVCTDQKLLQYEYQNKTACLQFYWCIYMV